MSNNIIITMLPIFGLFVILAIYSIYRHGKNNKQVKNQSEANAIIEAQAMLAKMQKEKTNEGPKKDEKEDINIKDDAKDPMSQNTETDKQETIDSEKEETAEEKPAEKKPSVSAPIKDTTDLEPDIDKTGTE